MEERRQRLLKLFGKEVYQSPAFIQRCQVLSPDTVVHIVAVTAAYYPLFRQLKHGLVLGQLTEDQAPDYAGPPLQFAYKVLAGKVFFVTLRVNGFSEDEVAAIQASYDL